MDLLDQALAGSSITVESSLLPAFTVDLTGAASGEQSLLTQFLRPRVTLRRNGQVLYSAAPAGDPNGGVPWGLLFALGAAGLMVWKFAR